VTIANPCVGSWAFCDNFESGTGAWTVKQGLVQSFTLASDGTTVYSQSDSTASALHISQAGSPWMDSTIEASLKPINFFSNTSSAMVTLWGHYDSTTPADCGYYVALRGDGTVALGKRVAGVDSLLGTPVALPGGINAGTSYDVTLEMVGATINAYVNGGNPVLSQTDSSCHGGTTGVGSMGASFEADDVRVTAPTPTPAGTKITLYLPKVVAGGFAAPAASGDMPLPKGVTRDSVVLGANGILKLNDRDEVIDGAGAPGAVSNAGSGETTLGAYSAVGAVTSVVSVVLRSWGTIQGDVQTGGTFTKQVGAQTIGTVQEQATLTPVEEFSWTVSLPTTDQGSVILQPDADQAVAPGSYAQVTANARAKLRLTAGSYYFASLDLESASELHLDKTAGPITIYVTGAVILRGGLVDEGGPEGDFMLVCLGTQDVFVEQAFTGTIVVPNAKLSLSSQNTPYYGTFFARDIESHQDNVIVALPFGWDKDCVQFGCSAPDMCHQAGVCDPATRLCSDPPEVDPSVVCNDGDSCTLDHCDPQQGCVHLAGGCSAPPVCSNAADPTGSCDDGNSCTLDHCDPQEGCVHAPTTVGGCSLSATPTVTCVGTREDGSLVAVFGYQNLTGASINISLGSNKGIGGVAKAIYPYAPDWFDTGTKSAAMAVDFDAGQEITWTLGNVTVTANANSTPCPSVSKGTITLPGGGTFIADRTQSYQTGYADSIVADPTTPTSGTIRGSFGVTDDGAATYRMPLWVPPGLMGVQPQLALSYSSTGGDGFLGRGWQMQGLSQITRCRQDYARDGKRLPIQWNDDDRLCLDGQRLVLVSGTYNAAGAEYRTEHDRFLKIVQVGNDSGSLGPTGFVVYQPDGTRHSYGYDPAPAFAPNDFFGEATAVLDGWVANIHVVDGTTDDPTVTYDTKVRYGWALASTRDRFDNRVQYYYSQQYSSDTTNRWTDFRPSYIRYTFNKLHNDADREIDFEYTTDTGSDARVDTRFSFVSGLQLRLGHLLSKIKMIGGAVAGGTPSVVRYYSMSYQQAARTSALLKTVQECYGNGICSQPTVFSWSTNDETYQRIPTGLASVADHGVGNLALVGDFNGDGRDDLVTAHPESYPGNPPIFIPVYSYSQANPSGTQPPFSGGGPLAQLGYIATNIVDVNGDGISDFNTGNQCYCLGAGTCTRSICLSGGDTGPGVQPYVGDFDGDGISDFVGPFGGFGGRPSRWGWAKGGTTESYLSYVGFYDSVLPWDRVNAYIGDFEGSGKAQFLFWDRALIAANGQPSTFMRKKSGPTSDVVNSTLKGGDKTPGAVRYQFADLNGDGLPDAIEIPNNGGDVRLAINTGRGFLSPRAANLDSGSQFGQSGQTIDPGFRIVDVNLDGRADVLYLGTGARGSDSTDCAATRRSKIITLKADNDRDGSVSLVPAATSYDVGVVNNNGCFVDGSQIMDANGDGLVDFIQYEGTGADRQIVLYQRQGEPPGLLKNVRDGYGATVDVTYAPMSDSTVYTRIDCTYPQVCNQKGRWLVATHTFDNGSSTRRQLTHQYVGARSDVTGIGWLGMDTHVVIDGALGTGRIETVTAYDLDPSQNLIDGKYVRTYPKLGRPVSKVETFELLTPPIVGIMRTTTFHYDVVDESYTDTAGQAWPRVGVFNDSVTTVETHSIQVTPPIPGGGEPPPIDQVIRESTDARSYNHDFGYVTYRLVTKLSGDQIVSDIDTWTPVYYSDDADNWLGGRLQKETSQSEIDSIFGLGSRVTSYDRDLTTNALKSTTIEPDSTDPSLWKETDLTRNQAGQVTMTQDFVIDPGSHRVSAARLTQVLEFDPVSGIFPSLTQNSLLQSTRQVYHPWLGVLVSETDANGLETRRQYDGFGRLRSEITPDGAVKQVGYYVADQATPTPTATHSVVVTQDGVSSASYYDSADRLVSVVKEDEKGAPYQTLIQYDKYGREASKWRPYPSPQKGAEQSLPHLNSAYDSVGRPTSQQFVSGSGGTVYSSKSWAYVFLVTTAVESGLGLGPDNTTTTTVNGGGHVVSATEKVTAKGTSGSSETKTVTTQFFYRPFGQLGKVLDDQNNETDMDYDARGRRRTIKDGDTGTTTSDYDAIDQLTKETYQDGNWVKRSYDVLGRMTSETTQAGTNTTLWDASANGIGKVSVRTSMDGVTTEFDYDSAGRPSGETWKFGTDAYRVDYAHDRYGRLNGISYPEVAGHRRAIYYGYDAKTGDQSTVSLGDPSGPEKTLWTAEARNLDGRLLSESFGDGSEQHSAYDDPRGLLTSRNTRKSATDPGTTLGYTYDARGYLLTRQQYLSGQGETFTHDEMGRLTKWQSTGGSSNWQVTYGYDSIGNLQNREETVDGTSQGAKTFQMGLTAACGNAAGPHSVTTVTSGGTTQCYSYDARGQQTAGADGRAVSYTEYGLPTTITRDSIGWQFGYDATHRRATKSGPGGSTTYVGSLYEKRVNTTDGTESHVMYVMADGEVKAQIVVDGTGGDEKIDYLMRDHLASVTEVAGDGDLQDMRFDPYGTRIGATPPPSPISQSPRVRLGFTGQEQDDDLGLVNMNGRIYDPALARFLTPDPLVSMRSPSQSWNRYSYADNSPLRFVDPSGLDPQDGSPSYQGNGPPGTHLECNLSGPGCGYVGNATGLPYGSNGWAGSSANNAVGANVGSFDEAGAGASSAQNGGGLSENRTLIVYNDIDDPKDPKQANRRMEVDRNQGDFEASLLKVVAKLTGIDMGDASIRRVLNADQLAAALESGSYSNVIYFGHVYNGNLAPTGPKGDQISVADFEGMLGAGVTNVAVIGCRSEGFAAQLNQLKPEIQTEGMRGDLYASVLNGAITSVWMGTRTASHVPIVLERFGEIY
jgi:RHS repeat-associated protein